ncbi:MAG: SIR2 family protein, partial [Pseudomonadota bacterium]
QPLEAAMRDLRLNRFLTLNYDLEIEREFHRWHRTTGAEARDATAAREIGGRRDRRSDFDVLCGFGDENERGPDRSLRLRDLPHDVKHVDGTRPSVRSNTLHPGNVGDLVNFAMHPRTFEAQVFHLHGRCDKPAEMVLTEKDYQRVYLGSGEQEHTFDEALSAIFAGNEVLFIGVGMDETDMLRPLRQFVSQDNSPDFARRPVYALMERECTLSLDFGDAPDADMRQLFLEEVKEQATRRSSLDRAGEKLAPYQTAKRDRIMENARALELKSQYGVHVIYYGDQELRVHRLRAQLIRKLAEAVEAGGDAPIPLPEEVKIAWEALHEPLSTKVDRSRPPLIRENEGRPEDDEA